MNSTLAKCTVRVFHDDNLKCVTDQLLYAARTAVDMHAELIFSAGFIQIYEPYRKIQSNAIP